MSEFHEFLKISAVAQSLSNANFATNPAMIEFNKELAEKCIGEAETLAPAEKELLKFFCGQLFDEIKRQKGF